MPHYLVERTFSREVGPGLPGPQDSRQNQARFLANNEQAGVCWLHSFVTSTGRKSFCLYEGPGPEAVRRAAGLNRLPVDRISEVHFQAPYEKLDGDVRHETTDVSKGGKS